ncbi:GDP-mannose 4,6-dehydratase [Candidatus Pacearchaeota archaeon]|nr:GDP-mannose 4,6-dehydratase [Candidatus Pacearchaeota archaeon]
MKTAAKKVAVITGVTGQDGSYLSELLLEKNYHVVGMKRRSSISNTGRIDHLIGQDGFDGGGSFELIEGDITDPTAMNFILHNYQPDEFYNLAAMSHVGESFKQPTTTFNINAMGVLNFLEAVRNYSPHTKCYQASSSELWGNNYTQVGEDRWQNEDTDFQPMSPYAVAKLAAHHLVNNYREAYGLHASCGLLNNHESSRRGEEFVTRKITRYIASLFNFMYSVKGGAEDFPKLQLGNLDARRDWSHAVDMVYGMWLMLQMEKPDDYVLASGQAHSVKDFCREAFSCVNLNWEDYVEVNPKFYRPSDVEYLCGNAFKAEYKLLWKPKISFKELVKEMVESDIQLLT